MRLLRAIPVLVLASAGAGALFADLQKAKAEPNLEKRAVAALDNAERVLKDSRAAYDKGKIEESGAMLKEVDESIELAVNSLKQTGKNPRKSPKYFKKAELQLRELLRRLDSFNNEMSVSDRPMIEPVRARALQAHDDILLGVVEGKKK